MELIKVPKKCLMWVTNDIYELPLYLADNRFELAQKVGCSADLIYKEIGKFRKGLKSRVVEVME